MYNSVKRLKQYNLKTQFIVFYDIKDWNIKKEQEIDVISFDITNNLLNHGINKYNRIQFEQFLYDFQGRDMIMNKPLLYSTTELEGYLADRCQKELNPVKRAIFPGDVDCVLFNNDIVKYVLEFKKHNLQEPIEKQSFKNYWEKDRKKYTGISLIARRFNLDSFYNIIYSTRTDDNKIKIERISTNLQFERGIIYTFPESASKQNFINEFNRYFQ